MSAADAIEPPRESFAGQQLHRVEADGVRGLVAIDSTIGGRSRGGLRLVDDLTEAEIRAAARAMTLKYGFLGFPHGGAKAGVEGDPDAPVEARRERLNAFARAAAPILRSRAYIPDADLGTQSADIRAMLGSIGVAVGWRERHGGRSGRYAAVSVAASARSLAEYAGIPLAGCTVAIEGFGDVGANAASLLAERGARIVAISTSRGALHDARGLDVDRLSKLRDESGSRVVERYGNAERLEREALLELSVDLLCPCARHHSIDETNASRVAARLVCAGANDPVSPGGDAILAARGILYPPDFVTNCGGVLGGTLEFFSVPAASIERVIDAHLARAVARLLRDADEARVSPRDLAERLALERHARAKEAAEHVSRRERLQRLGLEWYRRGWVPSALVRGFATRHIEALMSVDRATGRY